MVPSYWESWLRMVDCTQLVKVQSALHIWIVYVTVTILLKVWVACNKSLILSSQMAERTTLSRGPGLTYLHNLVMIPLFRETYWPQDWLWLASQFFLSLASNSLMFCSITPTHWIYITFSGWFGGMPGRSSSFGSSGHWEASNHRNALWNSPLVNHSQPSSFNVSQILNRCTVDFVWPYICSPFVLP